jgi:hypothetical protein
MKKSSFSVIQFIGTQRSGSNLLRVMLNQLPEISAPHPPHILKTFFPLLHHYGNLDDLDNFYSLAGDVCEWVNVNPVQWEGIHLDPAQVVSVCEERNLIEIFRNIYELKASRDSARLWCCKSMESVQYINELENSNLKPIYIHIYRDGRDVAVSFLKAIVGPKHIYHLAKKWNEEQYLSLRLKESVSPDRFISVKYEELIENPQRIMQGICGKLGVTFQEDVIMDYFHSKESLNTASSGNMWKNVARPILKGNHHKYLHELTLYEVEIFESIAGDMLDSLGYERHTSSKTTTVSEADVEKFNSENKKRMEKSLLLADEEDVLRRKPQEEMLLRIKNRRKHMMS